MTVVAPYHKETLNIVNRTPKVVPSHNFQHLKGPGEGTPLHQVYRYVPPQRVWFSSRFGLKTGIDFEHFGLKLGMFIRGTFTKAYKLIFPPSNRGEKLVREKEK